MSNLCDNVVEVTRISDRIMSIKINASETTLRVISCYAPQTGCPDDIKEEFWDQLDDHIRSVGPDEHLVIWGDLNGHVGYSRDGYGHQHGHGARNNDGLRILDFAEAHDLAVANTLVKKRRSHLITYASGTHLRLDIEQHRRVPTTGPAHIKWWRLNDNKNQLKIALDHLSADPDQPVADLWRSVANQIQEAACEVLGRTKPGTRFIDKQVWWWNEDVQRIVKEKKMAFKKWRETNHIVDYEQYRTKKSAAKRAVAKAKTHYDQLYADLDTPGGENKIYRLANSRYRATQDFSQVKCIKNDDHQILRDPPAILRRWREHFSTICNTEFLHPPIISADPISEPVQHISEAEVATAIKKMKNGKATGPDDIPAEVWKLLGRNSAVILAELFNNIIIDSEVPDSWRTSITMPIWKAVEDVSVVRVKGLDAGGSCSSSQTAELKELD
ncbi:uncharacterized protein LOC124164987 [Ischnura elegans]|uniref:uncharacterized protein LOC124164987 n=1 Tax=Ischnura elegans TaxID=197161 RepID=UPI001ED87B12|nr:uncharacterized protein LOC124164987 [Ischnura elegans]